MEKIKDWSPYASRKRKEEFFTVYENKENKTDQSQIVNASIVEMAKRYGIEAIIAKAEQTRIDQTLEAKLYGHDLTKNFKSKEELLNTKKRITNLFNNIPARIRKEMFNDDPTEFINAYVTNDEKKLESLVGVGLVSKTQYEEVKNYNKQQAKIKEENAIRQKFVREIEKIKGNLYENFKKTGNINFDGNNNNTEDNANIQTSIQKPDM